MQQTVPFFCLINIIPTGTHDESVSCDRSKTKRNVADYSSIHYFDIYPLSKELKEHLDFTCKHCNKMLKDKRSIEGNGNRISNVYN